MSFNQYISGKRCPSTQVIGNMKNGITTVLSIGELLQQVDLLREKIKIEDEKREIENIIRRKCFGYIYFINPPDNINIIIFTEGSLRSYQECLKRYRIFFDAAGFRSMKISGYKKILYYSLKITQHLFSGHSPIPVAGYITSDHTTDSVFLSKSIGRKLEKYMKLKKNPRLIKTDFRRAKIGELLLQYNQMN